MCGIAGYVGEGTPDDLNAMIAAVTHRGPDDAGTWFSAADKPVALGFRRLTILDPHTGAQPMVAENGDLAVVFNGEIYNHRDLREELTQEGARFRTDHSDTEVLLHAYAAWGPDMLSKLNGMLRFPWSIARASAFCLHATRSGKSRSTTRSIATGWHFALSYGG